MIFSFSIHHLTHRFQGNKFNTWKFKKLFWKKEKHSSTSKWITPTSTSTTLLWMQNQEAFQRNSAITQYRWVIEFSTPRAYPRLQRWHLFHLLFVFIFFFFTFSHTFLNNKMVKLTFFPYQASQLILFQSQIRRVFKQDLDYKTFKRSFLRENDSIIYYRHYR